MKEAETLNKMLEDAANDLWDQGLRASDSDIIRLCYGYSAEEILIISNQLQLIEQRKKTNN